MVYEQDKQAGSHFRKSNVYHCF